MKRMLARAATLAVAVPFAVGVVAGAAQAVTVTVPGCYGAGLDSTIVCDLTVTAIGPDPEFSVMYVKVCAGTCENVPVTWVEPGTQAASVCYSYKDGAGNPHSGCAEDVLGIETTAIKPIVINLFDCERSNVCAYE